MRILGFLAVALFTIQPLSAADFSNSRALVDQALASHPALARAAAAAEAARERIEPASALPNPMLMGGIQNKMIDFSDDEMMTMYMVGASQTLVRPEKREGRRDLAAMEARLVEKELDSLRAEIERDVLLAWYAIAAADAELRTVAQVREMTEAVIASARIRYEVGNAAQADVIRAQLQQSNLDHDILALRGRRAAAVARLIPLLGLPTSTEVPPLTILEGTEDLAIGSAAVPPADHPALAALEMQIALAEQQMRLARLDARPDIDIEAQYGYRRLQRDMFSVVARVELPLRKDRTIEPRVREAAARREEAKGRVEELRLSLTRDLGEAVAAHAMATSQMNLHHSVLVPQAKLAFESTLSAYQTGTASFDAVLNSETVFLRLQLQYFDFLARHAQAVVNYEALRRGARGGVLSAAAPLSGGSDRARPASMGGM